MTRLNQAIILAAGEGQRLRPFTNLRPKVMLPIANKPILLYVIEALAQAGLRHIIMVVGYRREEIQNYFGSGNKFGVDIKYVVQKTQIGTADALKQARDMADSHFVVLPGDNIIEANTVLPLLTTPNNTLVVKSQENGSQYGVVTVEQGKVTRIIEKPEAKISYLVNTGIYTFNHDVFPFIEQETDLPQVIQRMIDRGYSFTALETKATWLDAVYPADILRLNEIMLTRLLPSTGGIIEEGVTIKGKVSTGKGTIIKANSYLVGPVVIGDNCEIGPSTCIFPSTSIGDHTVISPFCQIKNSVIGNQVTIGANCYIQDSVIAPGCTIGNGVTTRSREITVVVDKETRQVKLGALLGDGCELEDNIVIYAGISLGTGTRVKGMKIITENIPEGSLVF